MKNLILIIALCVTILGLSACGKKGELMPPPNNAETN